MAAVGTLSPHHCAHTPCAQAITRLGRPRTTACARVGRFTRRSRRASCVGPPYWRLGTEFLEMLRRPAHELKIIVPLLRSVLPRRDERVVMRAVDRGLELLERIHRLAPALPRLLVHD